MKTAFQKRQLAAALLAAADHSHAAALDSYNRGAINLSDVADAPRLLAQARSTDVLVPTKILSALAEPAFHTGDSVQPVASRTSP